MRRATISAARLRGTPGLDELGHGGERVVLGGLRPCGRGSRADDERDLALRRLGEPRRDLGRRAAHDLLEALRQLAADGDPARIRAAASERSVAGSRCGDSNATAGQGQPRSSSHSAASAFSPRGRKPRNW